MSSGQPYNKPIDILKAKNANLAYLNLRAQLDEQNYQANKLYKRTGQLPTEMADTRTLAEKLADVQRLKLDLNKQLLEITDGENAQEILNDLSTNALQFLAQNIGIIKEQIKKLYGIGVTAPVFIDYLTRYLNKFEQTKGVELGLQQTTGNKLLSDINLIKNNLPTKNDMSEIKKSLSQIDINNVKLAKNLSNNIKNIELINQEMYTMLEEIPKIQNLVIKSEIQKLLSNITDDLPSKTELMKELNALEISNRQQNKAMVDILINKLNSLTTLSPDVADQLLIAAQLVAESRGARAAPEAQVEPVAQADVKAKPVSLSDKIQKKMLSQVQIDEFKSNPTDKTSITKYINKLSKYLTDINELKNDEGQSFTSAFNLAKNKYPNKSEKPSLNEIGMHNLKNFAKYINSLLVKSGLVPPMQGYGFKRMRGKGLARSVEIGIKQSPKFLDFGRYIINKPQLDKGIISIKYKSGQSNSKLPSERVTKNLSNVIKKMVGGSIPTYDDINSLTEDERRYLYKVSNEARLDDKLSIPTPKKDDEEKEINKFEILKGQILAGNDNKELVKDFKVLILKLSKKDLIPKGQVRELLLDLAALGH